MNIVFMGTSDFAVPTLKALAQHPEHTVCAIFTRPDAASQRGSALIPSPVRLAAQELGLSDLVHTPRDFYLRDEAGIPLLSAQGARIVDAKLLATIKKTAPDLIIVAAYGIILPLLVLELPRFASINIHASLLPRWRGAAPIQRALLAEDKELGVSIMRMEEGLDTGPYCATAITDAGEKNAEELTKELADKGALLLIETLPAFAQGTVRWIEQDESKVTYADKIAKDELALDPADSVSMNLRRVRASTPQAPARCTIAGHAITVLAAAPAPAAAFSVAEAAPTSNTTAPAPTPNSPTPNTPAPTHKPPAPSRPKHLIYACSDGDLEILQLKPDGKRAMSAKAFLAGHMVRYTSTTA